MISVWRSSATSGSIKSMISYGLILITSCGLGSPGPRVALRSGRRRRARSRKLLDWGEYSCALRTGGPVGRARWFIVGAAATAGALAAAPGAYQRLRGLVAPGEPPLLEPAPAPEPAHQLPPAPAAAFATYDPPEPAPSVADEDTAQLRLRIDETRDRIRRRAQGGDPEAAIGAERGAAAATPRRSGHGRPSTR